MNPFVVFLGAQIGAYIAGKFVVDKITNKPKIKSPDTGGNSAPDNSNQPAKKAHDDESKNVDQSGHRDSGDSNRGVHRPGTEEARLPVSDEPDDEAGSGADSDVTDGGDSIDSFVPSDNGHSTPPKV